LRIFYIKNDIFQIVGFFSGEKRWGFYSVIPSSSVLVIAMHIPHNEEVEISKAVQF
jgi:hypothetical protein